MMNETISILETNRLVLRPMVVSDFEALHRIFSDPLVMASFSEPPFTPGQMGFWLKRNLDHQERFGYGLFSVSLKETGELIGDCGLEQLDDLQAAELGYDFRSDFWNRGLATEAACAVRDYAFGSLRLPQLISLIRVGNAASRRVAEKVGMTLVEEMIRHDIPYWKFAMHAA